MGLGVRSAVSSKLWVLSHGGSTFNINYGSFQIGDDGHLADAIMTKGVLEDRGSENQKKVSDLFSI